jgi:hypothetical protein
MGGLEIGIEWGKKSSKFNPEDSKRPVKHA